MEDVMSDSLRHLREKQRDEVQAGLNEAERELAELDERRHELLGLIAAARSWLGTEPTQSEPDVDNELKPSRHTLHEAMEIVLREHPEGLRAPDLAREIASRGLYEGREGRASTQQIHARANNYSKLFGKEEGLFFAKRSLERIREQLDELGDVARDEYGRHGANPVGWSLDEYLQGVDRLAEAIEAAEALPHGTRARWEAEKNARNGYAQPLYFRGRRRLSTGGLGFFPGKRGEKGVDWEPTDLSRAADRIAADPLRQIYVTTASLLS